MKGADSISKSSGMSEEKKSYSKIALENTYAKLHFRFPSGSDSAAFSYFHQSHQRRGREAKGGIRCS